MLDMRVIELLCQGSRWLMAVVSYEQEPAWIITALANRKDPKRWMP